MTDKLKPEGYFGLSDAEVAIRLAADGYNELAAAGRRSILSTALGIIREPMFLLLVSCGVVYLVLGNGQEALMLLAFVVFVMALTFYQERKTENALESLRELSSPRALVLREGAERRIAGREVVRGDILIVNEGDRIPADAEILTSLNLLVDESLLTGESLPVRKSDQKMDDTAVRPGGDDLPYIYSGTMVVQGQAIARVTETGVRTELGKIGKVLQTVQQEETLLQKETGAWDASSRWSDSHFAFW
jgi:Ca2+-transporting ATPase